ncbi:MAG: asparaginase, partial [Pseudomonadales bacterium]
VIPHLGYGFVLKIDDGATRASEVALGALLHKISAISDQEHAALRPFFNPDIINSQGFKTGEIQASINW